MAPAILPPLISTSWLADRLGDAELVVLDTSWYLPATGRDGRAEYLAGHVPGAAYFDLDRISEEATRLPHMLPAPGVFAREARALGVSRGSRVVVYDGSGTNLSAARAWWMFRAFGHSAVTLLDGGLGRWRAEGRPLETGAAAPAVGDFTAGPPLEAVLELPAVERALAEGSARVVDVRSAGRFAGLEPEPREGLPSGHMPGAVNLPYVELVDPEGLALPLGVLEERLGAAGIARGTQVIATCGSGVSACTLLHALARVGHEARALYDGSWTEWASLARPVATGPAPR